MEGKRFDLLTRALGEESSRRSLMGLAAALVAAPATAAAESRHRKHKPNVEGPCGDGSRSNNICTQNTNCCTGICDTAAGQTNKDGQGRCRCVRRGGACTDNVNCCSRRGQQMTCDGGVCAVPVQCLQEGEPCSGFPACCGSVGCSGTCASLPEGPCVTDLGCYQPLTGGSATCVSGLCCYIDTTACLNNSDCCSGNCSSFACAALN